MKRAEVLEVNQCLGGAGVTFPLKRFKLLLVNSISHPAEVVKPINKKRVMLGKSQKNIPSRKAGWRLHIQRNNAR